MATQRYNLDVGNSKTLNLRIDVDKNDDGTVEWTVRSPDLPNADPATSTTGLQDAVSTFRSTHSAAIDEATSTWPDPVDPSGEDWKASLPGGS